jgi:hypothetical protein
MLKPYKPREHITVKLANGKMASTPVEARERWRERFNDVLGGVTVDDDTLADDTRRDDKARWEELQELSTDAIPMLRDIEAACLAQKPNRAHGEDAIPPDLFHVMPRAMSQLWYPHVLQGRGDGRRAESVEGSLGHGALQRKGGGHVVQLLQGNQPGIRPWKGASQAHKRQGR